MHESLPRKDHESTRANYDLDEGALVRLSEDLLTSAELPDGERYIVFRLEGDDERTNLGRHIEREVFEEKFKNDVEVMEREYGPYEDDSLFFINMDTETRRPSGVLRVVKNSENGLKTINDMITDESIAVRSQEDVERYHGIESWDEAWDVGTLAVPREYRHGANGADIGVQLYRGLYVTAMEQDVKHFISVVDEKAHNILTKYLGIPFEPLNNTEPVEYLGSGKSQAVYGYIPDFYKKMNRQRLTTVRGLLARKALSKLVKGKADHTLLFE